MVAGEHTESEGGIESSDTNRGESTGGSWGRVPPVLQSLQKVDHTDREGEALHLSIFADQQDAALVVLSAVQRLHPR